MLSIVGTASLNTSLRTGVWVISRYLSSKFITPNNVKNALYCVRVQLVGISTNRTLKTLITTIPYASDPLYYWIGNVSVTTEKRGRNG